uniref:Sphingolipid delta4-desaturase N-terminal domain-containing protein n=2 Tax=Rhodosorus marinus TaxID=101924 RepID=A0A7S0BUU7_9RHOD|mmetsp:Transcript_8822/g.12875  ORF Transcript_8822/g.12875 Transcript_8822/m.12875 type:complete len:341 (+) Transcript_8822:183-1205(+)
MASDAMNTWNKQGVETLSTEQEEVKREGIQKRTHPHGVRRKEILGRYPEISKFMGYHPTSFVYIVWVVLLQLFAGTFVKNANGLVVFLMAYTAGAVCDHALYVLIHDATHNLVFKSTFWNRISLLVANSPHVFPSAILFRFYHIQHHIELNLPEKDPDVPMDWEAKWVGNSSFRKAFWLANFAIFQSVRMLFYTHKVPVGKELKWVIVNWVTNLGFAFGLYQVFGLKYLFYLLISSVFSVGLHPLGARWIAEHYPTQPFQSTYSYYGGGNRVSFNIGFHNEHHDFPSIPWHKLPLLKKLAPEYYDTLFAHPSYTMLLWDFIMNPKWDLLSRFDSEKLRTE